MKIGRARHRRNHMLPIMVFGMTALGMMCVMNVLIIIFNLLIFNFFFHSLIFLVVLNH